MQQDTTVIINNLNMTIAQKRELVAALILNIQQTREETIARLRDEFDRRTREELGEPAADIVEAKKRPRGRPRKQTTPDLMAQDIEVEQNNGNDNADNS